jgi:hypothetical protein
VNLKSAKQPFQSNSISHQNEIAELLHLHAGLERQLKLAAFDDDVGEVEQVHLKGI